MGLIRRSFSYLDKTIFTRLFKAMVRPHIEYGNAVWYTKFKKVKIQIENVLRRATKKLQCCREMSYEERLKFLELPCMLYRKLRGDMIEVFKFISGKYDQSINYPLKLSSNPRSGTSKRLQKPDKNIPPRKMKQIRRNNFSHRTVNFWNNLPQSVINATSLNSFKNRLDKYWERFNIKFNFDRCLLFENNMLSGIGTGGHN